jgi:hemoglobin
MPIETAMEVGPLFVRWRVLKMKNREPLLALLGAIPMFLITLIVPALLGLTPVGNAAAEGTEPTLYKRLGGYDAIAAVVDDFIGRMVADPGLSRFFAGFSNDSKGRIRQLVVDQLCAATGGPCVYIGRGMKESHMGSGISEKDWQRSTELLIASMDKYKVGQKEKAEVVAALSTLKPDIVEKP